METPLLLHCGFTGCMKLAVTSAEIIVDSERKVKKVMPVCGDHAPTFMRSNSGVEFDAKAALNDLKMLHGLPPHDGFNPCCGDGHFMASLPVKYGVSVQELEVLLSIPRLIDEWNTLRANFSKRT